MGEENINTLSKQLQIKINQNDKSPQATAAKTSKSMGGKRSPNGKTDL